MKLPRLFFLWFWLPSLLLPAAPGAFNASAVAVELVAGQASIQPGQSFWVALKMNHDPHWHSYWINPGTGYATSLTWKLPRASPPAPSSGPAPHVMKDPTGQITGYGYENENFLFTQNHSSRPGSPPGSSVTQQAKAGWLMCKDSCVPGEAQVNLTLPVSATPTTRYLRYGAKVSRRLRPAAQARCPVDRLRHAQRPDSDAADHSRHDSPSSHRAPFLRR